MKGWTWRDLNETPPYVRMAFWDIAMIRRENEARRMREAQEAR
jgi:hypothetical protein